MICKGNFLLILGLNVWKRMKKLALRCPIFNTPPHPIIKNHFSPGPQFLKTPRALFKKEMQNIAIDLNDNLALHRILALPPVLAAVVAAGVRKEHLNLKPQFLHQLRSPQVNHFKNHCGGNWGQGGKLDLCNRSNFLTYS